MASIYFRERLCIMQMRPGGVLCPNPVCGDPVAGLGLTNSKRWMEYVGKNFWGELVYMCPYCRQRHRFTTAPWSSEAVEATLPLRVINIFTEGITRVVVGTYNVVGAVLSLGLVAVCIILLFLPMILQNLPTAGNLPSVPQPNNSNAVPAAPNTLTSSSNFKQVSSAAINVRSGPGPDQSIVTTLPQDTYVILTGQSAEVGNSIWVEIEVEQYRGWVNNSLLK